MHRFPIRVTAAAASVLVLLLSAGCATWGTTETENGSDIPWNSPQGWEGTILVPGMNER